MDKKTKRIKSLIARRKMKKDLMTSKEGGRSLQDGDKKLNRMIIKNKINRRVRRSQTIGLRSFRVLQFRIKWRKRRMKLK